MTAEVKKAAVTFLQMEKRVSAPRYLNLLVPVLSVVLALVFGGAFLVFTGYNPIEVYLMMFKGAFGSAYGLSETVVKAIPLLLAGLGVAIAFKMLLWNIGAKDSCIWGLCRQLHCPFSS